MGIVGAVGVGTVGAVKKEQLNCDIFSQNNSHSNCKICMKMGMPYQMLANANVSIRLSNVLNSSSMVKSWQNVSEVWRNVGIDIACPNQL